MTKHSAQSPRAETRARTKVQGSISILEPLFMIDLGALVPNLRPIYALAARLRHPSWSGGPHTQGRVAPWPVTKCDTFTHIYTHRKRPAHHIALRPRGHTGLRDWGPLCDRLSTPPGPTHAVETQFPTSQCRIADGESHAPPPKKCLSAPCSRHASGGSPAATTTPMTAPSALLLEPGRSPARCSCRVEKRLECFQGSTPLVATALTGPAGVSASTVGASVNIRNLTLCIHRTLCIRTIRPFYRKCRRRCFYQGAIVKLVCFIQYMSLSFGQRFLPINCGFMGTSIYRGHLIYLLWVCCQRLH